MARSDICGFFWNDTPPPKPPPKIKEKRVPPEPVWLRPDYLPGLEEARAAKLPYFTDFELVDAAARCERLVWDIECYPNYFLVAFMGVESGKIVYFEMGEGRQLDIAKLEWVVRNFTLIDFNGNKYDAPVVTLAIAGKNNLQLYQATTLLINENERSYKVLKKFNTKKLQINHIDIIELVALRPSLKLLAGRMHAPKMQDLPFIPGTVLSEDQITVTRWYCCNDLTNTFLLYKELLPDIQLREKLGPRYGLDLRSHSDAQMAEAILSTEIKRVTGWKHLKPPEVAPGTAYQYKAPAFLQYRTPLLNWVFDVVKSSQFVVTDKGKVAMPQQLKDLEISIAGSVYRMGIGGLHSSEKTAAHVADEDTILCDRDVASYYPWIVLNCGLAPSHLGVWFLQIYKGLVLERLQAKTTGDKVAADGLKIVVNGSFGKLGSKYSNLYSPDLLIQVTITGQLSLLMLIERLELAGIPVVSANTDGIVIKCPKHMKDIMETIVHQWEKETGFETEETIYKALYSRDVNNYIAVYTEPKKAKDGKMEYCKVKGVYAEKGSSRNSILSKNPMNQICSDAAIAAITHNTPVTETIRGCRDIRKFLTVRTVKGGAVKVLSHRPLPPHETKEQLIRLAGFMSFEGGAYLFPGESDRAATDEEGAYLRACQMLGGFDQTHYLGKAIRWYYKQGGEGEIVYAKSGNKVPRTEGAQPLMQLPDTFPDDINFDWYETEATKILHQIGFLTGEVGEEVSDEEEDEEEEDEEFSFND